MQVNEIRQKVRELTNTTTSDYSDASLIRDLNSEVASLRINILRDRGAMEFDDINYTNLPIGTFTVTGDGVCKITEDEDGNIIETIHKVAYLVGDRYQDVKRQTLGEGNQDILLQTGTVEVPQYYYEVGNSIVFPGVSGGTAKIWFDRVHDKILTGDTTKEPGIPEAYHQILAYRIAWNYAVDKQLSNENSILRRIQMEEDKLAQYEANRRVDEATRFEPEVIRGL
jgi:hypothetical protein